MVYYLGLESLKLSELKIGNGFLVENIFKEKKLLMK